ncbi:MAG: hypothetical protein NTZ35_01300 [Ignavibacteriales bacterium]|nr:hypothetical protein [Ignavibacteriales bacterium]
MINELFDLLDKWRDYPSYQLERRADIFFAVHLPALLHSLLGVTVIDIIPELPIRIGTIFPEIPINKSYKVDYAVFTADRQVLLVELKTDDDSTRDSQYRYYYKSIEVGFPKIVEGILDILDATDYKPKYMTLVNRLIKNGCIEGKEGQYAPTSKCTFFPEPIFIKPNRLPGDEGRVIEFSEIIKSLESEKNEVTMRFVKSLNKWTTPV